MHGGEKQNLINEYRWSTRSDINTMYTLNINQRFLMPDTELTLRIAKEIKEKLDRLANILQKPTEGIAEEAISQYLDIELWRHEQIMQGLAESENKEYADENAVKKVFKKNAG